MADEFEIDPDLDLDLDPAFSSGHQESLGESLGMGMEMGLQGEFQQDFIQPQVPKTIVSSSLSAETQGAQNGENLGGSLADELASAVSPNANSREERRRMREEYGLELDEEENDDENDDHDQIGDQTQEEEEEGEQQSSSRRRRGIGNQAAGTTHPQLADHSNHLPNPSPERLSSHQQSQRKPKSSDSSSIDSLQLKDERLASENESIYSQNTSSLIDSMRTNDSFLKKLRDLDGHPGPARDLEYDSLKLETASKDMIRNLQDHLLRRESQLREWREIELGFNRLEGEHPNNTALAGLRAASGLVGNAPSSTAEEEEDGEQNRLGLVEEADEDQEPNKLHEDQLEDQNHERDVEATESLNNRRRARGKQNGSLQATSTSLDLPPLPSSSEPASAQLSHLTSLNSNLILSLNNLHDQVQVQRAGMSDVGKRLRNLRSVFSQWRSEWESVERSRRWIEVWEGKSQNQATSQPSEDNKENSNGQSSGTGAINLEAMGFVRKPENIKDWTNQQLERFDRILNDAEINARKLLNPIQTPEIESLIEKGNGLIHKKN